MVPIANFFGINVEAFYEEDLASELLDQLRDGRLQVRSRGRGVVKAQQEHASQPDSTAEKLKEKLQDWRMRASPKSVQVIDQLALLAEKNALREDDWTLIEQIAQRMKTPS